MSSYKTPPPSPTKAKDTSEKPNENIIQPRLSLWDLSVVKAKAKRSIGEDVTTIFIVGNKSSGKTSLIFRFLEKNEQPKPTLALDFTFARKTTSDLSKEVCHIWELGGDALLFPQLIETPIVTNRRLDKFAIFVVLDLSVPETLWVTLEAAIVNSKKAITKALSSMNKSDALTLTKVLDEKLSKRLGDECVDKQYLEPFPLPIVIIGTKYDLFQSFEPEQRKTICRILRLASHRLGASLNFYSNLDVAQNRRVRELFSHYAFDTPFPKGICQDTNKPLMIPHGGDSFEQIWPGNSPAQFSLDFFKHLFESKIAKFNEKSAMPEDPAIDSNFKENDVDELRNRIMDEITLTERVRQEFSTTDNYIV
ncbi:unnamed protein product [Allacma fusca]|uniref:Cytoplasmic dynein 2 light intermediate chain 1 n=1 Tax=Allacma fusca TaxID=39272 RepID=A0A8J2LMG9_9HEXA|nr:unnamed protein product [Allacma fusca]